MKMNYRRNNKRKKFTAAIFAILVIIFAATIFLGRHQLVTAFSPVLALSANADQASDNLISKLQSKEELLNKIDELTFKNKELLHENRSRALLLHENQELKRKLGRDADMQRLTISRVLSRPPITPFDTLTIDLGAEDGVERGDIVLAADNTEIGTIDNVFDTFSRVVLYSSSGERTPVEINGNSIFVVAEGEGGGSLSIQAPRTLKVRENDLLTKPALELTVIGEVESVEANEADAFQTVRAKLPINIFEIKWVYVVTELEE